MTKPPALVVFLLAAGAALISWPGLSLDVQGQGLALGRPEWVPAARHDTSRPLREIPAIPPFSTRDNFEVRQAPDDPPGLQQTDPGVQSFVVSPLGATSGVGFDGVGEGHSWFSYNVNHAPPDTVGEAGGDQFVQWVNPAFAVFRKSDGAVLYGPAAGNSLWQGFGGPCQSRNDGDPIVQYDQLANRWVMTQFALQSGNYMQCVAISTTADATGTWHRYAFSYAEFPDYPKLSVWPDAYYITFNMFGATGSSFTGGRVCAYDRAKMLQGLPASQICFQNGYASYLVADLEGLAPPPAGTPAYVMNRGTNAINLWRFRPDFATPGNSTFTGPTAIVVNSFTAACSRSCVPQAGTSQKLDALGDRLMYRLSYRNLGTAERMVANHSVVAGSVIGIRWYEFDITGGVASVRQQGTYAPSDGHYRWMGSIGMDGAGNIAVGYSISSATMKPSIRFAGREATDPLGTLSIETTMQTGTGAQLPNLSRWGDYSSMSIDPSDDCTFWYTSEYLKTDGTFNWSTRIGSFRFSSCAPADPPPPPSFTLAASPASQTVTQGQATSYTATVTPQNGYTGAGTFSVSGLPAGATGAFSPTGYAGGSGGSTLTVTTSASTPAGTYPLTIQATGSGGAATQSAGVALVVDAAPPPSQGDFAISASPGSRVVKRGASGSYTVTVSASGGFSETVAFSLSGHPAGTAVTFKPASVSGSGSATLTITTTSSTAAGTYTLTIAGTSGATARVRSTTVSFKVQ